MTTNPDPLKEWRETLADLLAKCVLDRVERDGALHRSSLAEEISLGLFRASVVPNAHGEPATDAHGDLATPIDWGKAFEKATERLQAYGSVMYEINEKGEMSVLDPSRIADIQAALDAAPVPSLRDAEVIDLINHTIPRGAWVVREPFIARTWMAWSDGTTNRIEEIKNDDPGMAAMGEITVTEHVDEDRKLQLRARIIRYSQGFGPMPPMDIDVHRYTMPWSPLPMTYWSSMPHPGAGKPFAGGKLVGSLNVRDLKNEYLGNYFKTGWHELQIPESARIVYITEDGMIWDAGENSFPAAYDPNRTPKVVKINQRWAYYPMNGNKAFNVDVSVLLNGAGSGEVLGPVTGQDKDARDNLITEYYKDKRKHG